MNYYTAKFERENKARPTHWIIVPTYADQVELVHIGPIRPPVRSGKLNRCR